MLYFAVFAIALVMTIALIPPLMQFAGRLGLVDRPGERKVHSVLVPRVGGIGMVLSIMIPVFLWVGLDASVLSLLAAVIIIFLFGVWDDRGDLDYRLKFLGQILAACVVVFYGDITIKVFPFMGFDPVSPWFYYPLSVFVLVAVTNAINLADGLDGLAAGVVLLSLSGMGILAALAGGTDILLIALAVIGSIIGFLRFNTYPARVFMGDTGSQFLGFITCALLIMLTQQVSTALNPTIPLLLLGLPVFDTLFVMTRRIYYGKSPFSPDKNHIHHQLLALNFDHFEAVIIIYIVQAAFVFSGILLRYQSDFVVVAGWLLANAVLAFALIGAGRAKWRAHAVNSQSVFASLANSGYKNKLYSLSLHMVRFLVAMLLVIGPVLVNDVDAGLGVAAAVLGSMLFLRLVLGNRLWFFYLRLLLFVAVAFVVYLIDQWMIGSDLNLRNIEYIYFGSIALAFVIGAKCKIDDAFKTTPTDYLIVILMLGFTLMPQVHIGSEGMIPLPIKLVIMFYAIEVLLHDMKGRWTIVTVTACWAFAVIAVRAAGIF